MRRPKRHWHEGTSRPAAPQTINDGGQSPAAQECVKKILHRYTAHKILSFAIKWPQLLRRKSKYVGSLLGPGTETDRPIYNCSVLILGQAWHRAPALVSKKGLPVDL